MATRRQGYTLTPPPPPEFGNSLCRCNQGSWDEVILGLGRVLTPVTARRALETQELGGKSPRGQSAEGYVYTLGSHNSCHHPSCSTGRKAALGASRGTCPTSTWTSGFRPLGLGRASLCCSEPPTCGGLSVWPKHASSQADAFCPRGCILPPPRSQRARAHASCQPRSTRILFTAPLSGWSP